MLKKYVFWFFLCGAASYTFASQTKPVKDITEKLSIPDVEKYTLDNGLQVLLSVDKKTPFVALNVWYFVGSVDESPGKTGLAHLFEHLMFSGSKHVKPSEHFSLLDRLGATDFNASTHFDYTNYYQTMPKSQLPLTLAFEASRMTFLTLDQKSHQEQLAVVLRELEQRTLTTPYGEAANTLWQAVFKKGHPFHGRVIGSVEDLNNASLADLQNFYDRFYGPSNASLALVGDFDKAEAKALINKYFSTLPKNTKKTPVKFPTVILDKEEIIKVDEKIGKLALVRMHYLTPALFESGDAELDIFGEIFTTRLEKSLTREKRLVSAVSAYQQSFEHVSVFSVDAIVNPLVDESLIIKEIDMVLAGFEKNPPTSAELMRAKNTIQTNQFFGLENIGGFNGRAELLQIYNKFTGTPDFIKKDNLRYKNVDIESLKLAIKRYLPVGKARKILIAQPKSVALVQKGN